MISRIRANWIGPVREADIKFGDLTVFVGPQATGKSICLQLIKLLADKQAVHRTMQRFGLAGGNNPRTFFDLYFGEGMASIWEEGESSLFLGNSKVPTDLNKYAKARTTEASETMFYIPAQRVMSLRDGMTRPFSEYRAGDPFVLRDFSHKLHVIVQNEFGLEKEVFPRSRRIAEALRHPVEEHIFGKFRLRTDGAQHQSRLILGGKDGGALPYLVWSAGQREFVPLLLGLYWLMPPSGVERKKSIDWVVIEEPEMGLHPNGIGAVFNLVLELLFRGYRVSVSTHSPHVLDLVWALKFLQNNRGNVADVIRLLQVKQTHKTRNLAASVLQKSMKTYYFAREGKIHDISNLDPGSDDIAEGGWGGITEFSSKIGEVVADVANRETAVES